jgi:hypothetical protein
MWPQLVPKEKEKRMLMKLCIKLFLSTKMHPLRLLIPLLRESRDSASESWRSMEWSEVLLDGSISDELSAAAWKSVEWSGVRLCLAALLEMSCQLLRGDLWSGVM